MGSSRSDGSSKGGDLRAAENSWTEGTVTWSNAPTATGAILGSLGSVSANKTYTIDVTPAVVADGVVSFRLINRSSNGARYLSKEGSTTQPPQLAITCGGGGDVSSDAQPSFPIRAAFHYTTMLRLLAARQDGEQLDFLSDDLVILSPEGKVLSFPKPLTISSHTLKAIDQCQLSRWERATLPIQSRLHPERDGEPHSSYPGQSCQSRRSMQLCRPRFLLRSMTCPD